jgi:hypothetical protein
MATASIAATPAAVAVPMLSCSVVVHNALLEQLRQQDADIWFAEREGCGELGCGAVVDFGITRKLVIANPLWLVQGCA